MLAGFTEPNWGPEVNVFAGSRHEADAAEFETMGITFTAAKQARNSSPREA